jgi:hypothetical protein
MAEILNKELEKDLTKHEEKIQDDKYKSLIEQIDSEFAIAKSYIEPKWDEWVLWLKLYNNQRRDKEAVGDPLLFTVFQTILAALYDDRLAVDFLGRERGDDEQAENINILANYDQDDMGKDIHDYEWDWDTLFFGRGLSLFMEYDKETNTPIPEVIDPLTWYRDPRATSIHGDRGGRGALRFGGREIRMTKWQMRKAGVYSDFEGLKNNGDKSTKVSQNHQSRASAQGYTLQDTELKGENADFILNEWFTFYKNKRVFVTLGDNNKKIVRIQELDELPIIDRSMYPIAHDWDGVCVPNLTEDKQRGRAVAINLAFKGMKAGLLPMYLYDTNIIKNKADVAKFEFNKFIGVNGNPVGAIQEIQRQGVKQEVGFMLDLLDTAAQKATATPDIQQGATSSEKRTATELNMQSQKVDTRYSLSAKVFGWSEKRFWAQYYKILKKHWNEVTEKVVRIAGSMGPEWRKLTRENTILKNDPDIQIESKVLSDAKKMNDLNIFSNFVQTTLSQEPSANKRYAIMHLAKLSKLSKDEINRLLPKTFDEHEAEEENKKLENNQIVRVTPSQNHVVHNEIHSRAPDNKAKFAHMKTHDVAMFIQRERPELIPAKGNPSSTEEAGKINPNGQVTENQGAPATPTLKPVSNSIPA